MIKATPPTPEEFAAAVATQVQLWQHLAQRSADIAHAKRTLFNAYVAEGFTEAQAVELVKQP